MSTDAQSLSSETSENWIYIEGEYIDKKSMAVQNVPQMLQQQFKDITAEQVNKCFKDLFLNNQKRINIKLVSQNHEKDSELKGENKKFYSQ